MENSLLLFVSLSVIIWPLVTGSHCGAKKEDITTAKIPDDNTLLRLDEFDTYIVNKRMGEMYFALKSPPAFTPYRHYKATMTKMPGSSKYMEISVGETPVTNSKCVHGNATLTPVYGKNRSMFFVGEGTKLVHAMWSSCPTKYIWNMRCFNYVFGKDRCLLSDTQFGVYIHGDMDDAPIDDIVRDLCRATGIRFGMANFKWFFSFGEITLC